LINYVSRFFLSPFCISHQVLQTLQLASNSEG
jgi:hypothetical protein